MTHVIIKFYYLYKIKQSLWLKYSNTGSWFAFLKNGLHFFFLEASPHTHTTMSYEYVFSSVNIFPGYLFHGYIVNPYYGYTIIYSNHPLSLDI